MNRQNSNPEHDVDNERFGLQVFDATGVKLDAIAMPTCGDGHYYLVENEKFPTFSVVNPFLEPVTVTVFFNFRKEVEATIQPGESFRVLGDEVESQIWDLKFPLWGQRVDITFKLPVDEFRREETTQHLTEAIQDYLEALRSPRAEDEAQVITEAIQEEYQSGIRSGHACFRFFNEEAWEFAQGLHHAHLDRLLGAGSDLPRGGMMVAILSAIHEPDESSDRSMTEWMHKIMRTDPEQTFQA